MFEQAELQGTQMGPNGPPTAKERLKSPPKSLIIENQAYCLGHFGHFGQNSPFGLFWLAISEPGWTRRQKAPLGGVLLKST